MVTDWNRMMFFLFPFMIDLGMGSLNEMFISLKNRKRKVEIEILVVLILWMVIAPIGWLLQVENVFFILITTDVSEIVKKSEAVVSRLLEFRFKLIQWLEIEKFLALLLHKESTNCSMELCRELYDLSGRNLREVLVMLEHLSVLGKGVVTKELVKEVFGDVTVVKEIIMQLKVGDFVKAVELFDEFQVFQPDFKVFIRWFVDYLGSMLKQALKAGTRDSLLYGAMLKCTYGFISNRIVYKGEPAAKLLFCEIIHTVGGFSKSSTKLKPLTGAEVLKVLTSE